ncbi:nitroreductase [Ilumatobacter sp.]|uniref:nitroreductase n=1 Tax=Ilumatobacter sp. TaxID=1967498 RepID=UPI0030ACF6A4
MPLPLPLPPGPFPVPFPPLDGEHYLVVPRGETQCVRNIRAAGSAELRRGRTLESIGVAKVIDTDKAPIIRAYLELWAMKIGKFFDGLTKDSSDAEINAVAPGFPVFRITPST